MINPRISFLDFSYWLQCATTSNPVLNIRTVSRWPMSNGRSNCGRFSPGTCSGFTSGTNYYFCLDRCTSPPSIPSWKKIFLSPNIPSACFSFLACRAIICSMNSSHSVWVNSAVILSETIQCSSYPVPLLTVTFKWIVCKKSFKWFRRFQRATSTHCSATPNVPTDLRW